ncbi:MAG: hypothetical protein EA374_08175 [Acholeplasmatales bacterium]|nr:MAG: hypothetical protein EA374_08175 [Acholeplasmatales bacterium]
MRKVIMSFVLLLATFVFAACTIEALPREQNLLRDLIADFEIPAVALENITLPDSYEDVAISWSSDMPDVLSESGVVVRPFYQEGDVTVTLTATFTLGDVSLEKSFPVYVQALSEGLSDWLLFVEAFHSYAFPYTEVDSHLELPESIAGQPVQWTSNRQATVTNAGEVTQPLYFSGSTSVRMTLVAERQVEGENKVVWREFSLTVLPLDLEASLSIIPERLETFLDDHFMMTGTEIDYDIPLPTSFQGFPITWETSNIAALSPGGYVGLPLAGDGPEVVTLSAVASYDDGEEILEVARLVYEITVLPRDAKLVTETVSLPFTSIADEYIVEEGELAVYYMNNGSVPYVDIADFIALIEGAIVSQELEIIVEDGVVTVRYTYVASEEEDVDENGIEDEEGLLGAEENGEEEPEVTIYELIADFNENTVFVNRYGFFSAIAEATQTDFGQDLFVIDYIFNPSEGVTFDLGAYRMELVQHEDKFLMQFHLANLFFTGSMFDVYYNGDALIGVDTYQISALETIETLNETTKRGTVPYDMLDATYHFLNFTFDHFFGLKIASEIETYYEFFEARRSGFMSSGASTHYNAVFRSAIDLDDLHTDLRHPGYFMDFRNFDGRLFWEYLAPRTTRFFQAFQLELPGHCNAPRVRYFNNDTIALVRISGFNVDTPDQFRDDLTAAQNRGVETVIVDVSCNTGGIIGTMLQTLGYMTDEPLPYHSVNAGDGATTTAYYGTNNEAFDFDWYLLTSPVTYSAANLFASMVRELGIAPIVGEQSSGGASSITTNFLPSGAIVIMSSPNVLADANYESIEFGIPVDISVPAVQFGQFSNVLAAIAEYEASLPVNALPDNVLDALDYVYDPAYEYGHVVLENNTFTGTYSLEDLDAGRPMNDIARYLGALYRHDGSTVENIAYEGVVYAWNEDGTLVGSNWEDAEGNTLVSVIVAAWLAEEGPIVLTLHDGLHTLDLTFELVVLLDTLQSQVQSALDYAYDPAYTYGEVVLEDNTFTGHYTLEDIDAGLPMNDIARYLGALYRQEGSTVHHIEYDGIVYAWNEDGTLVGSNWEDAEGNTLVSVIVAAWLAEEGPIVLTLHDGLHTLDLTFVISVVLPD